MKGLSVKVHVIIYQYAVPKKHSLTNFDQANPKSSRIRIGCDSVQLIKIGFQGFLQGVLHTCNYKFNTSILYIHVIVISSCTCNFVCSLFTSVNYIISNFLFNVSFIGKYLGIEISMGFHLCQPRGFDLIRSPPLLHCSSRGEERIGNPQLAQMLGLKTSCYAHVLKHSLIVGLR